MEGEWKKLTTSEPVPLGRSSHSVVAIGRRVFVFGGEHQPRVPISNTVHCLDLDTLQWSELPTTGDVPIPRNAHTAAGIGHIMYVFGGRTGISMGEGSLDDLYAFDTKENVWTLLKTDGTSPTKRSYHTMAVMEKKLFVFGGCGEEGRMNDLYSYDTNTNCWKKEASCEKIEGRGGAGLTVIGSDVFVVGGFAGREMSDVHKYNTVTSTWTQLTVDNPLPPRSVFGIASISSFILVLFGEVDPSDQGHEGAGGFSQDCYLLDTQATTGWRKLSIVDTNKTVPEPRGWMAVAQCQFMNANGVFLFGGNNINNERLNDCHFLEIKM